MRAPMQRAVVATLLGALLLSFPVAAHAQIIASESDDVSSTTIAATLLSFGDNGNGQLGIGSTGIGTSTPGPVNNTSLGTGITDVSAGSGSSVAVRSDGTVWEWGWDGATGSITVPTQVKVVQQGTYSVITQVVGVARSPYGVSTLAIKTDGTLWSWGDNSDGVLGNGNIGGSGGGAVAGAQDYVAIAMGQRHALAVKTNGTVWAWGRNADGQLGLGSSGSAVATPTQVPGLTNVVAIAAGEKFSLAVKSNGTVWAWGDNGIGQLGIPCCSDSATSPTQVSGLTNIKGVSAGRDHALAFDASGLAWSWGSDYWGQLGNGSDGDQSTPVQIAGLTDVAQVAAGETFSMARKNDGTVWTWGSNSNGQLGTGSDDGASEPVQSIITGARDLAAGNKHALVVRRDGFGSYGEFTPLTPARILDTRDGTGRAGNTSPVGEGATIDVQITGQGGIPGTPGNVAAVVLNATVAEPTAASYLTVWPTGITKPIISNLNYVAGQVVPNLVTVAVGNGGKVSVFNRFGSTHVIFDIVGYYSSDVGPAGSRFHGVTPFRYFDTRDGTGGVAATKIGQVGVLKFKVTGKGGVASSGVSAVVMNVTITEPSLESFVTVYPDDVSRPNASNLNFVASQTVPNLVTVRVPASGFVDFYNHLGATHLLADVVGYYDGDKTTDAGRFIPVAPARLFDSRISSPFPPPGKMTPGGILFSESPFTAEAQAVYNVTVTEPTDSGYVTLFPDPLPPPNASNLNFVAGQTVPNLVIVKRGPHRRIEVYNFGGFTHLIIDKFGYFTSADA